MGSVAGQGAAAGVPEEARRARKAARWDGCTCLLACAAQLNCTARHRYSTDAGFFFRDVHAFMHILASASSNGGCGCVGAMPSAQPTGRIKPSSCKCSESSAAPHGAARHPRLGTRATFRRPPRAPNPLVFVCLFACSREGARGHHRYDRAESGTPPTPQTLNPKPALPANATPRVACGATLRAGTGSPVAATQDTVRHGRNAERCVSLCTWGLVAYAQPRGLLLVDRRN